MARKSILKLFLVIISLALIFTVWFNFFKPLDGISGVWGVFFKDDTVYASNYTESGFRKVKIGTSTNDVVALLGEPMGRSRYDARRDSWSYSKSLNDSHYRVRAILFKDGKVEEIFHEFYVD